MLWSRSPKDIAKVGVEGSNLSARSTVRPADPSLPVLVPRMIGQKQAHAHFTRAIGNRHFNAAG
jgi:hypothetical protein